MKNEEKTPALDQFSQLMDLAKSQTEVIDSQNKKIEELNEKINLLNSTVSKTRLDEAKEKSKKDKLLPSCNLRLADQKLVVKWLGRNESETLRKNRTFKNKYGVYEEILDAELVTEEGEHVIMPLKEFLTSNEVLKFRIVGTEKKQNAEDDILTLSVDEDDLMKKYPHLAEKFSKYTSIKVARRFINP